MGFWNADPLFLFWFQKESKGPAHNEKIVQENITSSKPAAQVMSEIPLESIFNDELTNDSEVFVEKGSNGGETKEAKPGETVSSTSTRVVTTSRTVVKSDGAPVTTVEKKVIVNGEEQPVDSNLLSPPALDVEVEEKEDGSEEGDWLLIVDNICLRKPVVLDKSQNQILKKSAYVKLI